MLYNQLVGGDQSGRWRGDGGNMSEHKDKTDCFAYQLVPIKGGGHKAKCEALTKLWCRDSKCSWYEPMEAYQERMEKQRQ